MAKSLVDHLRRSKDEYNWDIADICLTQCEPVVRKMCEDGQYLNFRRRNASETEQNNNSNNSNNSSNDGLFWGTQSPHPRSASHLDHGRGFNTFGTHTTIEAAPMSGIIIEPSFNDPIFAAGNTGTQFNDIFGQTNLNSAWDLAFPDLTQLQGVHGFEGYIGS